MDSRFALLNFLGEAKRYFFVEHVTIEQDKVETATDPAHHIYVVDASGSMYRDMQAMRATIEKVLTLEEFKDADQLVSLISYASSGDVVTHFSRVPVAEVMTPGSVQVEEIRQMRVRGLTCISQALEVARDLCRPNELTCISLHSDGYANDRSPSAERRAIDRIIGDFAGMGEVFVNTIAYSSWSDFNLLNAIANALSGKCIQATDIKQVFQTLHDTTALLAGQRSPAITNQIGTADYQIFVSVADQRVNGSSDDLTVRGLSADGDKIIYRYREVDESEYNASSLPLSRTVELNVILAYAKAMLAEGNFNTGKYALVSTLNRELIEEHARALTAEEIAGLCQDLDSHIFRDWKYPIEDFYGDPSELQSDDVSVLDVLQILNEHHHDLHINIPEFLDGYVRKSVKRLVGKRNDDGEIEEPWTDILAEKSEWLPVSAIEINQNTATANLRVSYPIKLIERGTTNVISKVAGVDITNLRDYRNYTIVADGAVTVGSLPLRITSLRAFRELVRNGILEDSDYGPEVTYYVNLTGRPLVDYGQEFSAIDGVFGHLAAFKAVGSILSALTAEKSDEYTPEQVEELKRHYLTPALYVSFPTCNEYEDLQEALSQGIIDTSLTYKVDVGTTTILNLGKLKSANEYLQRRFEVLQDGEKAAKPKWDMWWHPAFDVTEKALTARTKLDAVDDLMMPIFEDFLRTNPNGKLREILEDAQVDADLIDKFEQAITRSLKHDGETIEVLKDVQRAIQNAEKRLYGTCVCPLAFYVGASGLVPDEFDAKALDADALTEAHPDLKLAKKEQEGTFFVVGKNVISVYMDQKYFSTGRKPDAA